MKTILIASDHGGFSLKESLKSYLNKKGFAVKDLGTYSEASCDYPAFAYSLASKIGAGRFKRGILICKSGIGNSIVANRVPGVRAVLCGSERCARLAREHNDSNVLILGAFFVNPGLARRITDIWLKTKFAGGRHRRRLNQIKEIEKKIRSGK